MVGDTGKVDAFRSVGVCDEACRLNGSKYESSIGSSCEWHDLVMTSPHASPPQTKRGKKLDQMVVQVQGARGPFPLIYVISI